MGRPRIWVAAAPLLWIFLAYPLDGTFKRMRDQRASRWAVGAVNGLLALVLVLSATTVLDRQKDYAEPWRKSADVVAGMDGCLDAEIPVVWWQRPFTSVDDPGMFYGFYMPETHQTSWVAVPLDKTKERLQGAEISKLVRETQSGSRQCPVLLWAVIKQNDISNSEVAQLLEAKGAKVSIREISARDSREAVAVLYLAEN